MKLVFTLLFLFIIFGSKAQESIDDVAKLLRESQMNDETNDWVYFGTFNSKLRGIDNASTAQLKIDSLTTVRMYLLAKTDCYMFFDVRDQKEKYIFGTNDPISLENDLMGYKAATSIYTYEQAALMNINFGIRWGCTNMLDTELRLLVFYVNKNSQ